MLSVPSPCSVSLSLSLSLSLSPSLNFPFHPLLFCTAALEGKLKTAAVFVSSVHTLALFLCNHLSASGRVTLQPQERTCGSRCSQHYAHLGTWLCLCAGDGDISYVINHRLLLIKPSSELRSNYVCVFIALTREDVLNCVHDCVSESQCPWRSYPWKWYDSGEKWPLQQDY